MESGLILIGRSSLSDWAQAVRPGDHRERHLLYELHAFKFWFLRLTRCHLQGTWINAPFYANAWEALAKDGHWVEYDWTVEVDQLGLHFCYSDVRHCVRV